jgi:hypothetical protein
MALWILLGETTEEYRYMLAVIVYSYGCILQSE